MPPPPAPAAGEDHLYLISRSSLGDYLTFMTSYPVGAADADRKQLADEWLAADRLMEQFRRDEPDWADVGPGGVRPLPAALQPLAARVRADPVFRKAFEDVTWDLAVLDCPPDAIVRTMPGARPAPVCSRSLATSAVQPVW